MASLIAGAHGTTGLLATTVTASQEAISKLLDAAYAYKAQPGRCNSLLGVHLEGPFISHKWPGAQNPKYIVPPQQTWLEAWTEQYPDLIRLLTLAPETEGAYSLIEWLTANGIVAACGHTDADYEIIEEAVTDGLRHAVHTYNAMTGLHHRKPGTLGAVMTMDAIMAEVIADGHHVHPAAIRLLVKAKGLDRVILITDAMSAAGLGDGLYDLGGLAVNVKNGARISPKAVHWLEHTYDERRIQIYGGPFRSKHPRNKSNGKRKPGRSTWFKPNHWQYCH